jgi:hypothetical protein
MLLLDNRVKLVFLIALVVVAAVSGGGFFDGLWRFRG